METSRLTFVSFIKGNISKPYENTEHFESTGVDHLLLAAKLTMFRHMYHVVNDVMTTVPCEGNHDDLDNIIDVELLPW